MALTDEQRQFVNAEILRIIDEDYRQDFEPIYERAYQVLGDFPDQVSEEIRNSNNHNGIALNAEDYALALLNVERGRRHIHYAKHLALLQMVSHEIRFIDDYVATAEQEFKGPLSILRDRVAQIRLERRKIAPVEIEGRDNLDELRGDIQTMIEINTELERLLVRINETRLYLREGYPLEGEIQSAVARKIRRIRNWVIEDLLLLGTLAIILHVLAAILYTVFLEETVKSYRLGAPHAETTTVSPGQGASSPSGVSAEEKK